MKHLILLISLTTLTCSVYSQTVDPCNGNSTKPYDLSDAMMLFNMHGLNLSEYDWSNTDVNCHINMATQSFKKKQTFGIIADLGIGVGLAGLAGGAGLAAGGDDGVVPIIVLSSLITVGSVAFAIVLPPQAKKEMNYHLTQVDAYFKMKKGAAVK